MSTQTVPQTKFCTACGNQIHLMAEICPVCGVRQMMAPQQPYAYVPMIPTKDKTLAAILAIFLGWAGIHKFYLGKVGQGILYALFFWTGLPFIAGVIEGIIYLTQSEQSFQASYGAPYRTGGFAI